MRKWYFLMVFWAFMLISGCNQSNLSDAQANIVTPVFSQEKVNFSQQMTQELNQTVSFQQDPIPTPSGTFYLPVLMYHQIRNVKKQNPYIVSPEIFDQQMAWLQKNGYHTIHYDDFYKILKGEKQLPSKSIVITFDDGFRSQYDNAFPILKKYDMTATFYVYTQAVDAKLYMTWDMLKDLVSHGMEIASHTVTHANLPSLTVDQIRYELTHSKQVLESKLGIIVNYFAYPGGSFSARVIKEVQKAGYLSASTVIHGVFHKTDEDPYKVIRIHIDDDMDSFVKFITGVKKD